MKRDTNIFGTSPHLSTEQLLNYLRHNTDKISSHEVERHLTDCELCSDALDGLKKLDDESSMFRISKDLHNMARRRKVVQRKIFSQMDLIAIFALIFLLLFLMAVAFLFIR